MSAYISAEFSSEVCEWQTARNLVEKLTPEGQTAALELAKGLQVISGAAIQPVYLIMAEWGYPPFGGGECWLIDTMRWLNQRGFACYYIYFYDQIKKGAFSHVNTIDFDYGTFIQFPQNYLELLRLALL